MSHEDVVAEVMLLTESYVKAADEASGYVLESKRSNTSYEKAMLLPIRSVAVVILLTAS